MTTESKQENTTETTETSNTESQAASNKAVFGPLGKYAIVAVIMVSIIVTTAIMLNKELGTVEGNIASIENEVAEFASANDVSAVTETTNTSSTVNVNTSQDDVSSMPAESTPVNVSVVQTSAIPEEPADTAMSAESTSEDVTADNTPVASTAINSYESTLQAHHAQLEAENQARIAAFKLEQKQHMNEMFDRIKTLEAQQLERYKSHQDTQVERLREQIAAQQQMIDTLISRNKELYELRAANVQKQQSKREEIINRI
jgi:hypothetical protein